MGNRVDQPFYKCKESIVNNIKEGAVISKNHWYFMINRQSLINLPEMYEINSQLAVIRDQIIII